jgi:hypothetical protein
LKASKPKKDIDLVKNINLQNAGQCIEMLELKNSQQITEFVFEIAEQDRNTLEWIIARESSMIILGCPIHRNHYRKIGCKNCDRIIRFGREWQRLRDAAEEYLIENPIFPIPVEDLADFDSV